MTPRTFEIELSDGTHQLKFDNHALYRFEELHGESAVMVIIRGVTGVRAVNHFLWAGLLHEDPNLTVNDVIKMVESQRIQEYANIISKAVDHAFDSGQSQTAKKKAK